MPQFYSQLQIPLPFAQEESPVKTHASTEEKGEEHNVGEVPPAQLTLWNSGLVFVVLLAFVFLSKRRYDHRQAPKGIQSYAEYIVEQLNSLVVGIIGPGAERYTPLVGTLFLYIVAMNLVGTFPGLHSPTANISITLALGVIVFLYVQYEAFRQNGLGHILHFMGPKINFGSGPGEGFQWMAPLMFPIEVISECVRPFTLAIRLFGNIFGEDVIIVVLAGLGLTLAGPALGWLPIQFPLMLLSLLTSFVQALVFCMLTCIYLALVQHHGDHEAEFDQDGPEDYLHAGSPGHH